MQSINRRDDLSDSIPSSQKEFQEIAHCGGQFTIIVKTDENGCRSIQYNISHSRPTPASWFAIYALFQGIPVGTVNMWGIGEARSNPPIAGCFEVYIASDSLGMFGHQCPKCNGYWRAKGVPSLWKLTCPYCGFRTDTHGFLTEGQRRYVWAFCRDVENTIQQAIQSEKDIEYTIDMDAVVDAVGKEHEKPKFYYAEESQQNHYTCSACDEQNDILGRYGYCSNCGTHNGMYELEKDINNIRERIKNGVSYEGCVKDAVSAFDSYARQIANQLASRVPMTEVRRKEWKKKLFHNLKPCAEALNAVFDIDIFKGLQPSDIEFASLRFHRRHVYEHNGGEADDKYIRDSGDTSVRPKQVIRESQQNAFDITSLVMKMGKNMHEGFHDIFPPEAQPIKMLQRKRAERKRRYGISED